jgi:hypothetical protein
MHRSHCFCHFLNASWKSCSLRVFSTAYDSASITTILSKWQPFNRGNRKVARSQVSRVGWVGGCRQSFCFVKTIAGKRKSAKLCFAVMHHPVFVARVRSEVFSHFRAIALKVTVVCGIDCLACKDLKKMMHKLLSQSHYRKSNSGHQWKPGQESCIVALNMMHIRCSFVLSNAKSHRAIYKTANKRA